MDDGAAPTLRSTFLSAPAIPSFEELPNFRAWAVVMAGLRTHWRTSLPEWPPDISRDLTSETRNLRMGI
jgi:hypothetical protein